MRYLLMVKATPESERGEWPENAEELFEEMNALNQEMKAAGVLLDGAGLKPTSNAKRIKDRRNGKAIITDGPFTETKDLLSGFWLLQCKSMEEALSWAVRVPDHCGELELRPFYEPEDFEGLASEEVIASEAAMKDQAIKDAPRDVG